MHFLDFIAGLEMLSKKNERLEYWTILKWPAILGHFKIVGYSSRSFFLLALLNNQNKQVNVLDNRSLKRS